MFDSTNDNGPNDWVTHAIPSIKKGVRGVDFFLQRTPLVQLFYPGTYKAIYQDVRKSERGADNFHYGSLRFSTRGSTPFRGDSINEPKKFRRILREEALVEDPVIRSIVEEMVGQNSLNGYKFEIECFDKGPTSIEFPKRRKTWGTHHDVDNIVVLRLRANDSQATKIALLLARDLARNEKMPYDLDLSHLPEASREQSASVQLSEEARKILPEALIQRSLKNSQKYIIAAESPPNREELVDQQGGLQSLHVATNRSGEPPPEIEITRTTTPTSLRGR